MEHGDARTKKVVTAVVFAVVTCLGMVTTAAPAIRLIWVTANIAGCGAVIKRLGASDRLQLLPTHYQEEEAPPTPAPTHVAPLHDMHSSASCEIVAVHES